ncbi:MAG: hypothetical protein NTU88_15370 [Armatimonadetes bacterium]|nr:hypothetical protein [Armatimonadota bacterium]
MPLQNWGAILVVALLMCATRADSELATRPPEDMKPPVVDGIWLRPTADSPAEPVIGFKDGIRIAVWPGVRGPRGIIRVCTPYVFPDQSRSLINFIAVEPIVGGRRSYSELREERTGRPARQANVALGRDGKVPFSTSPLESRSREDRQDQGA